MRIGIDYTPAVRQRAGIGRYTRGLVQGLAQIDRENQYVLLVAGREEAGPEVAPTSSNFQVKQVFLSEKTLTLLWHRLHFPLPVDLLVGRVDMFHSPDFVSPPLGRGASVVTVHDLSFLRHPQCAEVGLRTYLMRAVPRAVRQADLVLADSESTREDLVSLLEVAPGKVRVVYAGVEENLAEAANEEAQQAVKARFGLDFPFLLYVGTLEPRKNLLRLLEAYAQLRGRGLAHRLVLAGIKGWLYEDIFRRAEELRLGDSLVFTGYVCEAELPALYSLAEVFVFPSLYEGFGLPPLEAMACGTPVVASNVSAMPEVLGGAALLVNPHDVEALAAAVEQVVRDSSVRAQLIEKGRARVKLFTWKRSAQSLLEAYQSLG